MKRHYFIGNFLKDGGSIICLDTEIIHQLKNVLKIKLGEEVMLGDGKGVIFISSVDFIDKKQIKFSVIREKSSVNSGIKVRLYAAFLKKDNFEWLVQKAVEVGVDSITPIITERTVKSGFNIVRLKKIIKEASEQCERPFLPDIFTPIYFKEALDKESGGVLFDPSGEEFKKNKKSFGGAVFVGPEGGFTEEEADLAKKKGVAVSSLGSNILRGETAAIVAVYLAKNYF